MAGTGWRDGLKLQAVNNMLCQMLGTAHHKRSAMVPLIVNQIEGLGLYPADTDETFKVFKPRVT